MSGEAVAWILREWLAGCPLEYLERKYDEPLLRERLLMFMSVWLQSRRGGLTTGRARMALWAFYRDGRIERDPLVEMREAKEQAEREAWRADTVSREREAMAERARVEAEREREAEYHRANRLRLTAYEEEQARKAIARRKSHGPSDKARLVAQRRKEPLGILQRNISFELRNALIYCARAQGHTEREIGEWWKISTSRVHQINNQEQRKRKRWLPKGRQNLGRPIDMGGPRDQWLEFTLENNAGH